MDKGEVLEAEQECAVAVAPPADAEALKRDIAQLRAILPRLVAMEYVSPGEVTEKQRQVALSSDLYQRGDMRLVWVSEGDMYLPGMAAGPLRRLLDAISPPKLTGRASATPHPANNPTDPNQTWKAEQ